MSEGRAWKTVLAFALIASALIVSCSVQIDEDAGRLCDLKNPCSRGRVCVVNVCTDVDSLAADGGMTSDAGMDSGTDAGSVDDAGANSDAGLSGDAGANSDAGLNGDAGYDAGFVVNGCETADVMGQSNLIPNGTFDDGTNAWSAYHGSTLQTVTGSDGGNVLEITGPNSTTQDFGVNDVGPNWATFSPSSGVRYCIGISVRASAAVGSAAIHVREYNDGGTNYGDVVSPASGQPLTSNWQRVTLEYQSRAGATYLDLLVIDPNPAVVHEIFQVDDISVRRIP